MKKIPLLLLLCLTFVQIFNLSLKEIYKITEPNSIYDKVLTLETGVTYTGGLLIGNLYNIENGDLAGDGGFDVKFQGNGAILDLDGQEISISYCSNRLDIENCVIINGNIRFRGIDTADDIQTPIGSIRYITFYNCHDYAIRLQGSGEGILLERNIAVNSIDTGWDYVYVSGCSTEWLRTGINFAPSGQFGSYGMPVINDNFSYFENENDNFDNLKHFTFL